MKRTSWRARTIPRWVGLALTLLLLSSCGVRHKPIKELSDAEIRQVTKDLDRVETLYLMIGGQNLSKAEKDERSINELIDAGYEMIENDSTT